MSQLDKLPQEERLCKNCGYFESWHGWPRGDCDHPTREVAVEVNATGTCEKFKAKRVEGEW